MLSKTAKNTAFFLFICLITLSGGLAQESPYVITVFNNVGDVPEKHDCDIEFNGITIVFVSRHVFMPENRIEPLDFKEEFTVETASKNQKDDRMSLGDDISDAITKLGEQNDSERKESVKYFLDENITFNGYPDDIDNGTFSAPFLDGRPFMRCELEPVEIGNWTVGNITLTGKIRVRATIFKNGFCLISLVFPIVTEDLKNECNLQYLRHLIGKTNINSITSKLKIFYS